MSAFKVVKGELRIDLSAFVDLLGQKERDDLSCYLVASDRLFKAVLECVADKSQHMGSYFNDDEEGPWWFDSRTVLEMREKLIPIMDDIAKGAVTEALRQRDHAKADQERHQRWAWQMFHAWPDAYRRDIPPIPDFAESAQVKE